jgi:hypothetical protein
MGARMRSGINFAKVVTILAIIFGVSLGLCGLTVTLADRVPSVLALAPIAMTLMIFSLGGFVVVGLVWVVMYLTGGGKAQGPEVQKLFEDDERDKR